MRRSWVGGGGGRGEIGELRNDGSGVKWRPECVVIAGGPHNCTLCGAISAATSLAPLPPPHTHTHYISSLSSCLSNSTIPSRLFSFFFFFNTFRPRTHLKNSKSHQKHDETTWRSTIDSSCKIQVGEVKWKKLALINQGPFINYFTNFGSFLLLFFIAVPPPPPNVTRSLV